MRKKLGRIAALLLAAAVAAAGIGPAETAKAADTPEFTVKVSSSTVKPGEEITVELWLESGGDLSAFVGNLVYDTEFYELVSRTKKDSIIADLDSVNIDAEDGSISILVEFESPYNEGGLVYTIILKAKDEASGTGEIGFDFYGGLAGTEDTTIPAGNDNVNISVTDANGTALPAGAVTIDITLESMIIDAGTAITMEKGDEKQLNVSPTPEKALVGKNVTWTSSDSSVVSVGTTSGTVTAVAPGTATVTAAADGKTASVAITVTAKLNGISLNKSELSLLKGKSEALEVTYDPADTTDDKDVTWTSSDETAATVEDGVVTGTGKGTATITATVGTFTETCTVTVEENALASIKVTEEADEEAFFEETFIGTYKGESYLVYQLKTSLTGEDSTNDVTDAVTLTYKSSDEEVAVVSAEGKVTVLKIGEVTITVTASVDGKEVDDDTVTLNITEIPLTEIAFKEKVTPLEAGQTTQLEIQYYPVNATDVEDAEIVWSSSNESIATVEDGLLKALTEGKTEITAKVGDLEAFYELTVTAADSDSGSDSDSDSGDETSGTAQTGDSAKTLLFTWTALLSCAAVIMTAAYRYRKQRLNRTGGKV